MLFLDVTVWIQAVTEAIHVLIDARQAQTVLAGVRWVDILQQTVCSGDDQVRRAEVNIIDNRYRTDKDNIASAIAWCHTIAIDGQTDATLH